MLYPTSAVLHYQAFSVGTCEHYECAQDTPRTRHLASFTCSLPPPPPTLRARAPQPPARRQCHRHYAKEKKHKPTNVRGLRCHAL